MTGDTVAWTGVLAVEGRAADDGRILRLTGWKLPRPLYRRGTAGTLSRRIGTIDTVTRDGELIRATGRIRTEYAGRTLTGGLELESTALRGSATVTGRLGGFMVGTEPVWPEVQITADPLR